MAILKIKNAEGQWQSVPALKGESGTKGDTPNITFTAKTLASGSAVTVTKSGTSANPTIEIGIPRGKSGANGAKGNDADASHLVAKSGNRGALSGYQTATVTSSAVTINANSSDQTQVTGAVAITVATGEANTAWTKSVSFVNASATVTLGDSWVWSGGEAPEVTENSILVLYWCNDVGVAKLFDGGEIY